MLLIKAAMIPYSSLAAITPQQKEPNWRLELAQAVKSVDELIQALELTLTEKQRFAAHQACKLFPLRVTRSFLKRIRKGDLNDPLLRQILPIEDELNTSVGFSNDPVGDLNAMPTPGLLHKYHGRALLVTTGACGIHCRYCFRREFPYANANPLKTQLAASLDYLRSETSISEIILSGGDPLTLADSRLAELSAQLAEIPHIKRIRVHTRLPVILPSRINTELLSWLTNSRLKPVFVIHANHAQEISSEVLSALKLLKNHSVPILNQAVLLKGVNDSVASLSELSEVLFDAGVTPYYLHQLDRVNGAAHYEVPLKTAKKLIEQLRKQVPGYLMPTLVQEAAGAASKLPIL